LLRGGFFRSDPAVATPDVQLYMIIFSADAVGAALHPANTFAARSTGLVGFNPRIAARLVSDE